MLWLDNIYVLGLIVIFLCETYLDYLPSKRLLSSKLSHNRSPKLRCAPSSDLLSLLIFCQSVVLRLWHCKKSWSWKHNCLIKAHNSKPFNKILIRRDLLLLLPTCNQYITLTTMLLPSVYHPFWSHVEYSSSLILVYSISKVLYKLGVMDFNALQQLSW